MKRGREKIDTAARHEDVAMRPETKHSARNKAEWHRLQSCINHPATKGGRENKAGVASGRKEVFPVAPRRLVSCLRAFPAARRALKLCGLAEMLLNSMPLVLFRRGANSPRTVKGYFHRSVWQGLRPWTAEN